LQAALGPVLAGGSVVVLAAANPVAAGLLAFTILYVASTRRG
jgi:hypothetical protein